MKKVLVTGSNGFVGPYLIEELRKHDFDVVALGGGDKTNNGALIIDLLNKDDVSRLDFNNISCVIHLAGLSNQADSYNRPSDFVSLNAQMQINLFEESLKQKSYPKFLIISTGAVYSANNTQPLTESSITWPNSPYSVSKLLQEELGRYYISRGFKVIFARPFNHIGPGQGPGFIVPDFANQLNSIKSSGNNKIKVGNLEARRDYTDVRDIARAYRLLIEKGKSGEIYNIGCGNSISGGELLDKMISIMGVNPKIIIDKSKFRPIDVPEIRTSINKIYLDTGWKPSISLEKTLEDILIN